MEISRRTFLLCLISKPLLLFFNDVSLKAAKQLITHLRVYKMSSEKNVFEKLGLPRNPVMLAPLAGVSDYPFRMVCQQNGADLTYVEMLSATALCYKSQKTFDMLYRHPDETKVGVQITSKTPEEMGEAVALIEDRSFETVDINMGCPVKKVVKVGCGSAIMKDPERVYQTTLAARKSTKKPLSVKIRRGWDNDTVSFKEVALAAQDAGAEWVTIHGRLRNNDYSVPVNLECMTELKQLLKIPVIGNGNIFSHEDAQRMLSVTGIDGVMVSRGALGNPWVFNEIKTGNKQVSLDAWFNLVTNHLQMQIDTYQNKPFSAVCMRKHLLWYLKGWPGVKYVKDEVTRSSNNIEAKEIIDKFKKKLVQDGFKFRSEVELSTEQGDRFVWDPKWEMDRKLDRGVGDDHLVDSLQAPAQVDSQNSGQLNA